MEWLRQKRENTILLCTSDYYWPLTMPTCSLRDEKKKQSPMSTFKMFSGTEEEERATQSLAVTREEASPPHH